MLAAQGAPPLPKLSDMKGDADASVMGFFNSYAAELPDELAAKCRQVGTEFLARFGKTRLGPLFMLPAQKARDVLVTCNLDDGWLESIEEQAGFRFKEHSVPPSAELVCALGETAPAKQAKRERKRPDTISEELGDMLPQETIPKWIFDKCITTHEPLVKTLTEPELSGMTSEILSYFASRFGHFKLGSQLCRHLGNKLTRALPHLPAYGSTLGIDRRWGKMLADKAKNRQYVRAAHEPAPSCPSLTQSVPCLSQKDFNTPIEIRSADMTEAVKLKLESSGLCSGGRVTIDISKSESSAESFAVKDEVLPQQPDVPPAAVEVAPPATSLATTGISIFTMPSLASTKPPLPPGAPPVVHEAESTEAVAAAAAAGAKRADGLVKAKAKRAATKLKKQEAAAAAAEQPPPPAPPPASHRRPPAAGTAKRKAADETTATTGRKKSVRAPPQHAPPPPPPPIPSRPAFVLPTPLSPTPLSVQVQPNQEKENVEPAATKPKEKPKDEGVLMIVRSPDDDDIQLRMKGEESATMNGASLGNGDEVLVLEIVTSAFGTDFASVKAGRIKGFVRAAYLVAA